jgi:glycosyltransferase involved in cell wall biosynthesis
MRVCLLSTFYPPWSFGGDGIQVRRLARLLAEAGHEVTVAHSPRVHGVLAREPVHAEPVDAAIEVMALDESLPSLVGAYAAGRPFRPRRQLESLLARDFDVVHFHNPSLLGAPALFGMASAPTLYTAHEQWLLCPGHDLWRGAAGGLCEHPPCRRCELAHLRPPQPWRRTDQLERHLPALDALIAPSRASARLHARFADRVPVRVIDHFVPDPGEGAEPVRAGTGPYFLYAGRLEPIKGAASLVDAFRGRRERLVVAGDGSRLGRLRRRASANVEFAGWVSEERLDALYRGALAVVVPTLGHEAFGLVAAEAFARGVPVLVHDFGALGDLAADTGAALTYRGRAELSAALDRLAADAGLRRDLGRRGRAAYLARFTPERHLRAYTALVGELSGHAARPVATSA